MEKIAMTNHKQRVDALVIGAGPAGATTALLLAKAGWSVAIVEKKRFPRRKVCGEFMSATNLPLLRLLGISDFYLSCSGPEVRRVGVYAKEHILTSAMPASITTPTQWGRALGREHLDLALLQQAKANGAHIWQPACVNKLTRYADEFICTIGHDQQMQTISAKIVIMANGSWERGVESSPTRSHQASDLLAFKARFTHTKLDTDLMPLLAFPGGYGGMVHTDHNSVSLSCCIRRSVLQHLRLQQPGTSAGEVVLGHIMHHCRGVREALSSAQRDGAWLAAGPIQPGIRQHYHDGIFFVGNRVGEAHPIIAEGISMALQSAWLLANTLLTAQPSAMTKTNLTQLGNTYRRAWRKGFARRIQVAKLLSHLAIHPQAVALLLPLCARFPFILTQMAALSGKVQQVVST